MAEGAAKLIVRVVWGIVPGSPTGEWRRALTDEEAHDVDRYMALMGEALARYLDAADANVNNWATLEWLWL